MRQLTPDDSADLLVGSGTGDDAAVWRLSDERALVVTADFITPVVDDARTWGRVAAANAVSDVYAMGGRPLLALNLVGWNVEELELDLLAEVLAGGADIAAEAGFVIGGGHTIDDPEPKYGMALVGEVDPGRMLTNAGLRPGDHLVLSKPLGVGIVTTAIKFDRTTPDVVEAALASMVRLNADAATVAVDVGATGATDITGFGLLGHGARMAKESGVDLELWADTVPYLPGVRDLAAADVVPGGTVRNLSWAAQQFGEVDVDRGELVLLADAQTSGGLLFGVAPERSEDALAALEASEHTAAIVGRAVAGDGSVSIRAEQPAG